MFVSLLPSNKIIRKCSIICNVRTLKQKAVKKKSYTSTVHLPQTKFPQWMSHGKRSLLDEHILKTCGFNELYSWQRENLSQDKEFILHDGPPYANGLPHMGHFVNKILKDIIIRRKVLEGIRVDYRPGWDCHGLPIELKVLHNLASSKTPMDIRKKARTYAKQAIADQKEVFRSWGVMADWDNDCYYTYDPSYIKNQLIQFYQLFKKGLIYRDLKPVYWSPSSKTALAEAELEYNPNHKSRALTVRLEVSNGLAIWGPGPVYLLIWTTTPWTLPSNQAVAFNQNFNYVVTTIEGLEGKYILAKSLLESLKSKLQSNIEVITEFSGSNLVGVTYKHPFSAEELPLIAAEYVTPDVGTGLVHTAPAHGHDDFILAKKHNLIVKCCVDKNGNYTREAGCDLSSMDVLGGGADKVIDLLKSDIVHSETVVHSYPYDWRTKCPVIVRASKQWFIDTSRIKDRAIELAKNILVYPNRNMGGLISQVEKRPYWCISRQRVWGVPIPVIYDKNDVPIINKELLNCYLSQVDNKGPDFWWSSKLEEMIPEVISEQLNIDMKSSRKGQDILDIWFDSGLSWSYNLEDKVADLYLEGIDQFTGWFQSSLLTSVALADRSPYKTLFVHGFAVDEEGRKMSKSIGNVVDPQVIIRGGEDRKKEPALGLDILRWWVGAHSTQHANIPVGNSTLSNSSESVRKLRNLLRFLLGSVTDLPPPATLEFDLLTFDQYTLHKLDTFTTEVSTLYETYQFNKISIVLMNFLVYISGLYCHSIKDRLYCDEHDSSRRRAAQYTLLKLLEGITFSFAPLMPVLAEEVYLHHPHNTDKKPYFFHQHSKLDPATLRDHLEVARIIDTALAVKEEVVRESPVNCSSNQLRCRIWAHPSVYNVLKTLQNETESNSSELVEILQTSEVVLMEGSETDRVEDSSVQVEVKHSDNFLCPRCRRYTSPVGDQPCQRCSQILGALHVKTSDIC